MKKLILFLKNLFKKRIIKENWIEVNNKYKSKTYIDFFNYYELHPQLSKQCYISWKCNCQSVAFKRELKNNVLPIICDKLAKLNI